MRRKLASKDLFDPKRARIRQSWHPHNLYNLYNQQQIITHRTSDNLFRQKWASKAATRAYHGEQVREHRWEKMFSRYIPAVVPMDTRVLTQSDGSDLAAGRGAGLNTPETTGNGKDRKRGDRTTHYMSMTYWPLERRLDTAVFRALFSPSIRSARQMVIHGHVKVNGKKMVQAGYLLNPGDLFSVNPDVVLHATGLRAAADQTQNTAPAAAMEETSKAETETDTDTNKKIGKSDSTSTNATETEFNTSTLDQEDLTMDDSDSIEEDVPIDHSKDDDDARRARKASLSSARTMIDNILEQFNPSGVRKRELRALRKRINPLLSQVAKVNDQNESAKEKVDAEISKLETDLGSVFERIEMSAAAKSEEANSEGDSGDAVASVVTPRDRRNSSDPSFDPHIKALAKAYGEILPNKKYVQPWQPRDWMAPFAMVPRYLEVNWTICSAVYLRHPVARPGIAEIPSPFNSDIGGLAYAWYLRRR